MVNVLNFQTLYSTHFCHSLFLLHFFHKILRGMANSAAADQTAFSGSGLFAYAIVSQMLVYKLLGQLYGYVQILGA